jgi:hypothetical protein
MASTSDGSPDSPGSAADAITRHAVIIITCVIAATSFAFSFGNVADLCLRVGIPQPLAWLVSPPVDLSVTGLLLGLSILSQRHPADEESRKHLRKLLRKLRLMLLGCGALTIALNTSGAAIQGQLGAALVDAILPTLLILWSEAGPPLIRELTAATQLAQPTRQQAAQAEKPDGEADKPAAKTPPALHPELIEQARVLDAEHRQAHRGRPISRDNLRSELAIARNTARALIQVVRSEPEASPAAVQPPEADVRAAYGNFAAAA